MTTKRKIENTNAWRIEWKNKLPVNIVEVSGKVGTNQPCKEGQIRRVGTGRILLIRHTGDDFLICQISDFKNPAADSEIRLRDSGNVLQIWGAFRAPESILKRYPVCGEVADVDICDAELFWNSYYSMTPCKELEEYTGFGSIYDTDDQVDYMDHSTSEISDLIVRVFQ